VQFVSTVFKLGTTATTIMSCITVSLEGAVIVGTKMLGRYQASATYMGACKYRCAHWQMNLWTRHMKQVRL
jgi:hypothetical protein